MASTVVRFFVNLFVERPAARRGSARLAEELEQSADALLRTLADSKSPERAAKQARHILGIERWGQQRLRVALGERAFERDSHHPYLPDAQLNREGVVALLREARAETVKLARRLASEGKGRVAVEHNSIGPLTADGWLRYLKVHADLEAKRA
jgi:hypothetical protein